MTQPEVADELETAIAEVYRGPFEQFVGRRDALAKQLRASKQREHAERVKALRKPGRVAWLLDNVSHEEPDAIQRLEAAIDHARTGDDVRTAFASVKATVANIAAIGARVAVRAEQPVDANVIAAAVHAIIGHADAFAAWRAGRLVEVPTAGGLDMLATIALREPSEVHAVPKPPSPPAPVKAGKGDVHAEAAKRDERAAAAKRDFEFLKAARAELRHAESMLAKASAHSEHSAQSVLGAQKSLEAAERALLNAQELVQSKRADLERTRSDAASAVAERADAERAVEAARLHVGTLSEEQSERPKRSAGK